MKLFRSLLILLVVAALGILGAQWLRQESIRDLGEVIVHTGGRDYIATVPQAIVALLIALLLLWLLWSLLAAPFRAWRRHRRRQGRARLIDGLLALDYGQWQRAEKLLAAASSEPRVGPVALVGALRAAEARGDNTAAAAHLQAVSTSQPTLHALHSAERFLAQGRASEAVAALDAAPQPLPPRGLWLRTQALASAGRADEAYGQLGALRQQQVIPADTAAQLEADLAVQMLNQAEDINQLAAHWEVLPRTLRVTPAVINAYAQRGAALGWNDTVQRALEQALDSQWEESLVPLHSRLSAAAPEQHQLTTQRWLQAHPNSPALLISAAQNAIGQGQWAQAEDLLHRAVAQGGGAPAWEHLGTVSAAQGDLEQANRCLRNALLSSRGEAIVDVPERALHQRIADQAVAEVRNEHGIPQLPGHPN